MGADFCSVTLLWHNDDLPQWDVGCYTPLMRFLRFV